MVGMRERKKQARHEELIGTAIELFRQKGYEQTTMEEIAARADVSAPTLYRYFPTKSDLLLGLFWQTRASYEKRLERFHANAPDDAIEAIAELIYVNNGDLRSQGERKMWREVMAALLRSHDKAHDEFQAYKAWFEVHIERLLLRLKAKGLLSRELPVPPTVATLYAVASEVFYRLIANEFETAKDTRPWIRQQTEVILRGWISKRPPVEPAASPLRRLPAKKDR